MQTPDTDQRAPLGFEVSLPLAFEAGGDATRAALKAEGFGVLTEIGLQPAPGLRGCVVGPACHAWRPRCDV